MSVASGTATTVELRTLAEATHKLGVMLAPYLSGAAQGGATGNDGSFTKAQIDSQISAVSAAITAVNA